MIETKKAKALFKNYRDSLSDFLTPNEISHLEKSPKPETLFAVMLAAKEAVFKARRRSWMGLSGFQEIETYFPSVDKGQVRLSGESKNAFEFYYLQDRRYTVVWSMS